MAGSIGTIKIKQRVSEAEKRRINSATTIKRRKGYFERKNFILAKEIDNFGKICVVLYEDKWWRMFAHSALLYKYDVASRLKIDVKLHPDQDHGKNKSKSGVVYISSIDSLKERMKRAKAKLIYDQNNIVIFALGYECPPEKMKLYEEYEEDCWSRVNKLILPKESMPVLRVKLKAVAADIHVIVHAMKSDVRDSFGLELDRMGGKLLEDFLMMSNGWQDKQAFLGQLEENLQLINAKLMVLTELRLVEPKKVFRLLNDLEKAQSQIEIERKLCQ